MTLAIGTFALLMMVMGVVLAGCAALIVVSVMASYTIAWYDRVNTDPAIGAHRCHALAARLVLAECAVLLFTLLLRPFGWLPAPVAAGASQRPPVILLHGLFQNRSCMFLLRWRLRVAGYDRVVTVNTPPWHTLEQMLDTVTATVERVHAGCGHPRVALVGHSMGGILARGYLQLRDGAGKVAACITLGSPHAGSKLAPFAISQHGRDLLPGSALLTRLQTAPLPENVQFTAIRSRHDNIIVPPENAMMTGAVNVELTGLGHTALLFSPRVAQAVAMALGENLMTGDR